MADENKPVDAGGATVDADALKKQLEEYKAKAEAADADKAKADALAKELIEQRDKAKEEKRKAEQEALTNQGQFKQLYETTLAELEAIKAKYAEVEPYKAKYEETSTTLTGIIDQQRAAILETIPEGEERDKWKDSDLSTLQKVAPIYAGKNGTPPVKPAAAGKYTPGTVDFADMTDTEQMQYGLEHNMSPAQIALARAKAKRKR